MPPSNPLPRYYRAMILLIAGLQWLLVIVVMWFPPPLWESVFRIPIPYFRWLMLGIAVPISAYTLWMHPQPYRWLTRLRQHPASIWLVPLMAIPALPLLVSPEWIGYTLIGLEIALAAALVYAADEHAPEDRRAGVIRVLSIAAITAGLALRLAYVFASYVWNDEGIYMSVAANMLEGGGVSMLMYHLPADIPIRPGIGYSAALFGLWARLFGIGLIQMRVLSYLAGVAALIYVFASARRWWGTSTAILTGGIFALSQLFLQSTWARNDAIPMLMVAAVLWLHIAAWQRRRLASHMLVGLAVALLIEGHLTNLVFLFSFSAFYAIDYLREAIRKRSMLISHPLWPYTAGFAVGFAVFVWLHILILPDPAVYFDAVLTSSPSSGSSILSRLDLYVQRVMTYASLAPAEALLIIASLIAAAVRRGKADLHWLQLALLTEVGFVLLAPYPELHYSIYGLPIYLMGTGALFMHGTERDSEPHRWSPRLALYGAAALLLASHLTVFVTLQNRERIAEEAAFAPTLAYIREHYPPETAIIAPSEWYAYLPEYRTFLLGDTADVRVAPIIAGVDPEAYWMNVLLQTWPSARIERDTDFYHPAVYDSYMAARGAMQINEHLSVVDETEWVRVEPAGDMPLQLVAYSSPKAVRAGQAFTIKLIMIKREADYAANEAIIRGDAEDGVDTGCSTFIDFSLLSTGVGKPVHQWTTEEFQSVEIEVQPLPCSQRQYEISLLFWKTENSFFVYDLGQLNVP